MDHKLIKLVNNLMSRGREIAEPAVVVHKRNQTECALRTSKELLRELHGFFRNTTFNCATNPQKHFEGYVQVKG
jgi:hypothetical protein